NHFDAVAANVADGNLGVFAFSLAALNQFAATLLCERSKVDAHQASIILRIESDVSSNDGALDGLKHILLPGLNAERAGIKYRDVGNLVDRHRRTVIVNLDTIKHLRVCLSGSYLG